MSVSLTKIESEEYEEALSLAHTYGLDTDLVYQRQWRKSAVNIASIQNYLVCVNICGNLMKLIFMDYLLFIEYFTLLIFVYIKKSYLGKIVRTSFFYSRILMLKILNVHYPINQTSL